jgi:hypothetical protein
MNKHEEESIRSLLKESVPPVHAQLSRDLWPQMLQKIAQQTDAVPWFDWALLGLLVLWWVLSPSSVPVLLYHL